jgi:hypothetical protein
MPKKERVFIDPEKIWDALSDSSPDNPITADNLEKMTGCVSDVKSRNIQIRLVIKQMVQDGYQIGSTGKGYYRIHSGLDFALANYKLDKQIAGTLKRKAMLLTCWKFNHPNKHLLKLKKEDT